MLYEVITGYDPVFPVAGIDDENFRFALAYPEGNNGGLVIIIGRTPSPPGAIGCGIGELFR